MYVRKLTIKNFKGIREVAEVTFSKISIIVGRNDAGKSSILEAIYLSTSSLRGLRDLADQCTLCILAGKYSSITNLLFRDSNLSEIDLEIKLNEHTYTVSTLLSKSRLALLKKCKELGIEERDVRKYLDHLKKEAAIFKRKLSGVSKIFNLISTLGFEVLQLIRPEEVLPTPREVEEEVERRLEIVGGRYRYDRLYLCTLVNRDLYGMSYSISHTYGIATFAVGMRRKEEIQLLNCILIDVIERGRVLFKNLLRKIIELGLSSKLKEYINTYIDYIEDLDFVPGDSIRRVRCLVKYRGVDRPLDIELCGYGIKSFITALLAYTVAEKLRPSIILIEEPENTLHPGLLRKFCEMTIEFAKKGVQVILSTHSLELIREFINVLKLKEEGIDNLNLIALKRDLSNGMTSIANYTGEEVELNIEKLGYDLRLIV